MGLQQIRPRAGKGPKRSKGPPHHGPLGDLRMASGLLTLSNGEPVVLRLSITLLMLQGTSRRVDEGDTNFKSHRLRPFAQRSVGERESGPC